MRYWINAAAALLIGVSGAWAGGCSSKSTPSSSSGEDAGKPRQCLPPPAAVADLMQPEISFSKQIVPIVNKTCSVDGCHGDKALSLGIYLPPDPAEIHKAFVSPSTSNLKLDFVKAGAPDQSFLMHKLDGTQCSLDKDCVDNSCGAEMPPTAQLSLDERTLFRRWIAQGAKNN